LGSAAPALETREVEQVADHTLEAVDLDPHGLEQTRPVLLVERERGILEALGRHADGGERGAQVMADGLEDGGLDRVAPPQRLRLDRLATQALPVDRHADEGGERRQEAAADGQVGLRPLPDEERSQVAPAGFELERRFAGRRLRAPAEHDPGAVGVQDLGNDGREALQLGRCALPLQEAGRQLGEEPLLPATLLGLPCALPSAHREVAGDDPDKEVDGEREPVFPVGKAEGVERRQEEEVEERRARQGDRDRIRTPEEHGDREHGKDIEDAEAEHRDEGLERVDRPGDERERDEAEEDPGAAAPRPRASEQPVGSIERAHRRNVDPRGAEGPASARRPLVLRSRPLRTAGSG